MATTLTLLIVSATAAPGAIAASGAPLLQAAAAQTQPAPVATGSAGGAAEPAGRSAAPAVAAGASKAESHDAAAPGAPARPDLPGGLALPSDGAKHPDGAHFDQVVASSDGSVLFASGTARLSCPAVSCPVLFRSIDGGEHWARLPAAGFLGGELLLPPDPSDRRLFAASNLALQVSSNGGDSFETVPAVGGPAAMSPLFDAGDPTILIGGGPRWEYDASAGTSTPAALVLPTASAVTRFAFSPDNRRDHLLFAGTTAAGSQGAVYRCVDKLCDHSVSLPGLRATPFVAVSPRFAEDRRVWVWSGTSLFRSDDRGLSYQAIPLPTDGSVGSLVLSGPSAYLGLWKDQRGAGGGLFRTDDGGATWHAVATDERFSEGVTGLAVTGDRLVAAVAAPLDRPSLLWSADGGATWDAAR